MAGPLFGGSTVFQQQPCTQEFWIELELDQSSFLVKSPFFFTPAESSGLFQPSASISIWSCQCPPQPLMHCRHLQGSRNQVEGGQEEEGLLKDWRGQPDSVQRF